MAEVGVAIEAVVADVESVVETDIDKRAENVEHGLQNEDVRELGETMRLPFDKVDYLRMSVAEKVHCYPFDNQGTDLVFKMVWDYFEKIGMDTSFNSVYEESKLLTDYYEKQKADILSEVFGFGNIEYFAGIKLFN